MKRSGMAGRRTGGTNTQSDPMTDSNYDVDNDLCYEVDRQIKEMLARRRKLRIEIRRLKRKITKHNLPWNKNKDIHIQKRTALIEEKNILEGRFRAAVYVFREPAAQEFTRLKNALEALGGAAANAYDGTPANSRIIVPYHPVGDMEYIMFSSQPLCISLRDDIFCIIPYYILQFKQSGAYVRTYYSQAIRGGAVSGPLEDSIGHIRTSWTYTRAELQFHVRYGNNSRQGHHTEAAHAGENLLELDLAAYRLKYKVDESIMNNVISSVRAYAVTVPVTLYDPVYHLVRLLKECDENNSDIEKLERIFGGGVNVSGSSQTDNGSDDTGTQKETWKVSEILKLIVLTLLGSFAVLIELCLAWAIFAILVSEGWVVCCIALVMLAMFSFLLFLILRALIRLIRKHTSS